MERAGRDAEGQSDYPYGAHACFGLVMRIWLGAGFSGAIASRADKLLNMWNDDSFWLLNFGKSHFAKKNIEVRLKYFTLFFSYESEIHESMRDEDSNFFSFFQSYYWSSGMKRMNGILKSYRSERQETLQIEESPFLSSERMWMDGSGP